MPVYSMTGYASTLASAQPNGASKAHLNVELRSVNGRFLDLVFKLPDELRSLEPALREQLSAAFRRGKIEMRVSTQREADGASPQPSPEQLQQLKRLESAVQAGLPQARALSVNEALNWCRAGGSTDKLDDTALQAASQAIRGLREARAREGEKLVLMLQERIVRLRELAAQAEPLVPAVIKRQQERFLERWRDALEMVNASASIPAEAMRERAMGEAVTMALRIDVAEELSRLRAHLEEIDRLLKAGGELGKRLDFLIQELHREANTLGSKSAALELTGITVEMKVLVEQMREQVQNIE